jgi:peroxiredoxin
MVRKYGEDDIQFVGINVGMNDTVDDAKAFVEKNKMTYPNVFDKTGELSEKYQLNKVFALILVSKDGTMMMRLNNIPDMDASVLEMLNSYNSPYSRKAAGDAVNGDGKISWQTLVAMI